MSTAGEVLGSVWPVVLAMAVVGGARVLGSRRRRALNRALHELRRPLQVLALAPEPASLRRGGDASPGPLELALAALDDLDVAINGTRPILSRRPVAARPLVVACLERWHPVASRRQRPLTLDWRAGEAIVMADPARLSQALDNLIANAIEHGAAGVRVCASRGPVGLRVSVTCTVRTGSRPGGDPRRGHGLAVVERVAAAHLGRFRLRRCGADSIAVLELPLAPVPLPAVPIEWAGGRRPRRRKASGRHGEPALRHAA